MASSEEYRRHAGECVRLAQQTQNTKDKALLLAMAETWLRLAQQAESKEVRSAALLQPQTLRSGTWFPHTRTEFRAMQLL